MLNQSTDQFARIETTCGVLLRELEDIWREVGEPDSEKDAMLIAIEQECIEVFRRKVEEAKRGKTQLQKAIATSRAEIVDICSSMGGLDIPSDSGAGGSLKEELRTINLKLDDLRKKKLERKTQFIEVMDQLRQISRHVGRSMEDYTKMTIDETDLSTKKLEELRSQLTNLQNEKNNQEKAVEDHLNVLNSLCLVLGADFRGVISEIHPSLCDSKMRDISIKTIKGLAATVRHLRGVKSERMQKLQHLAVALLELWNLLNTPMEEQKMFQNVTCTIAASEEEISEPNILSISSLKRVENEVLRLNQLKSTKIKELILGKKLELEEICRKTHMAVDVFNSDQYATEAIESGVEDPGYLLEQIDMQIAKVKDEAFSRREILEKVEKWLAACEEEGWLEEYNRDENRYNAGRGAHLSLKRAEKARALVNKIPGIVEALTSKVTAWEKERGTEFLYDGVRLISMLEHYNSLRQEKELEKQRQRDQRKHQVQRTTQQEARYGSKPSPTKSGKKIPRTPVTSDRKLSLGGAMLRNLKPEKATPRPLPNTKTNHLDQNAASKHPPSVCRRNSEISGGAAKSNLRPPCKAPETNIPVARKPLSPVPLSTSSNVNIARSPEDHKQPSGKLKTKSPTVTDIKAIGSRTPERLVLGGDEENRTPKRTPPAALVPSTPAGSVAMTMATTPATPFAASGAKTVEKPVANVEYSFEEVRAGFTCHRPLSRPILLT